MNPEKNNPSGQRAIFKRCFCELEALAKIHKDPTINYLIFGTRRRPGNPNRGEFYPW